MAKTVKMLSAKEVGRIKTPGMHPVGPSGLYLQISGASARSWVYRYQIANKPRWAGLGSAGDEGVSLADDPRKARRVARQDPRRHRSGCRSSRAEWQMKAR